MKVSSFFVNNYSQNRFGNNAPQRVSIPSMYLSQDTVSFTSMKKTQFRGVDALVVEKFKAPIEKFNTNEDLQNWASDKCDEIVNKDYFGRSDVIKHQRESIIKEWANYVREENGNYSPAQQLLILEGITKNLKPNDDTLPVALNKGTLADVMSELEKTDCKQFNFLKTYKNKLQASMLGEESMSSNGYTGWVVIPSKEHDSENFEANVTKLQTLSHNNWCTKSYNAEPYLSKGDFHVYLEEGKPKLGVRFVDDEIAEIQGEENNSKIPIEYYSVADEHIKENNLKLSARAQREVNDAQKVLVQIEEMKAKIQKYSGDNDTEKLFRFMDIDFERDKDGKYIIKNDLKWNLPFPPEMLGLKDKHPLANIKKICGNVDLRNSDIKSLESLREISGNADFSDSKIENLGNLQTIGGNANFEYSKIDNLGNLQKIGGNAYFSNSKVENLSTLQSIGGNADFGGAKVKNLNNLQSIGGNADFGYSKVENLANLQSIGGYAYFIRLKAENLSNLQSIGGEAWFIDSKVENLGNLQTIGGNADFRNTKIENLANLQSIGGDAYFSRSKVENLDNLQIIGGRADFRGSKVENLANLQSIGGEADFSGSKIENLDNLQKIGGAAFVSEDFIPIERLKEVTSNVHVVSKPTQHDSNIIKKIINKFMSIFRLTAQYEMKTL